jgi:hypothetical protein
MSNTIVESPFLLRDQRFIYLHDNLDVGDSIDPNKINSYNCVSKIILVLIILLFTIWCLTYIILNN